MYVPALIADDEVEIANAAADRLVEVDYQLELVDDR